MSPDRPRGRRVAICQGAQQGSGGPSGTKDDPMHVNVTNRPLMPNAKYDTPKPAHYPAGPRRSGLRIHRLEDEDFAYTGAFEVGDKCRPHLGQPRHVAGNLFVCSGS
jgi:hypothetical protein